MEAITSYWLFTPLVVTLVVIALFPLVAGYIVLVERKVLADFQVRLGPMRVGPHGLLQPIADALKLMLKEDIIPTTADKLIFVVAPILSAAPAFVAFSIIPVGPIVSIFHHRTPLQLADLIGLDTCLSIMNVLHDGFADSKYRPCPLLRKMVAAGWLGRKAGRGFYEYGQA